MKQTPEENQAELQRYKVLVQATIDYLLNIHSGTIVYDGVDPIKDYYEQQKLKAEKRFHNGRLDRLQQQLNRLTESVRSNADLHFGNYIKERTGETLDLFSGLNDIVEGILARGSIENDEEMREVDIQLEIYKQSIPDPKKETILLGLIDNYLKRREQSETKETYTRIITREENGIIKPITVTVHLTANCSQPALEEEHRIVSPDGKRKLRIRRLSRNGTDTYTEVDVDFPERSVDIFAANSLHPGIKARWKDNNTVIIEIPKEVVQVAQMDQHHRVQSFDEQVTAEYIIT